jgi:hypothetical protein
VHLSKIGIKALISSGIILGLMAFAWSGVAQAEPTAHWGYINPTTLELEFFSKTLKAKPLIELEKKTANLLFVTGGGTKVTQLCTEAEFDEGDELSAEGSISLGRIKFKECVTFLNGVLSKPCEPHTGAEKGVILTQKFSGLIKLHELTGGVKDQTVLLMPDEGELLATWELGEECSIGESVPVTGELVIWNTAGNTSFKEHKVAHLIEEFPGLHLLKALGQSATISGSANVTLRGEHTNFKWAGEAG